RLVPLRLAHLVVRFDDGHGFNVQGSAAGRLIVDDPRHLTAMLLLHGNDVPAVAQSDNGLLQVPLRVRRAYQPFEVLPGPTPLRAEPGPNLGQLRAGVVDNVALLIDAARDFALNPGE